MTISEPSRFELISNIDIEVVRGCNLNCRWCPLDRTGPQGFLSLELLESIIEQIDRFRIGWGSVALFRCGEPLLHPYFADILKLCSKSTVMKESDVNVFTNGMLVNEAILHVLYESNVVNRLVFSVDGIGDKKSYEYIRKGATWERLLSNIKLAGEVRQLYPKCRTKLEIETIVPHQEAVPSRVLLHEQVKDRLRDLFYPLGVSVFRTRDIHRWDGRIVIDGMPPMDKSQQGLCMFIRIGGISILYDGQVSTCCADINGLNIIGNLREKDLIEIYFDEPLAEIRTKMLEGKRAQIPFCNRCDLFDFPKEWVLAGNAPILPGEEWYQAQAKARHGRRDS